MTRALIDTSALFALIVVVWLPFRRRMSAQLAHGLFCLVLLKVIVPVPIAWSGWQPLVSARQAAEWVSAWARPGEPAPNPAAHRVAVADDRAGGPADDGRRRGEPGGRLDAAARRDRRAGGLARPVAIPARQSQRVAATYRSAGLAVVPGLDHDRLGLCCVILLLARFLRAMVTTRRLMREAMPLRAESLPIDLAALQRAVGLRTPVRWAVNFDLNSPAVGGLLRPVVVLPPDLSDSLTPKQLTWVLLHELAHVRRGDLWVVVVQRVVQAVFFFHPAVHLANWIIDELREYACDDAALAACKTSRRVCGEGFLAIVERSVERVPIASPALGLFESRLLIRRRLIRILDPRRTVHARLSRPAAGVLAGSGLGRAAVRPAAGRLGESAERPPIARDGIATPCDPARSPRATGRALSGTRRRHRTANGAECRQDVVGPRGRARPGVFAGRLDAGFGRRRRGGPVAGCGLGPGGRPARRASRRRLLPGLLARRQDARHGKLRPDRQAVGRGLRPRAGPRSPAIPTGSSPWHFRPTARPWPRRVTTRWCGSGTASPAERRPRWPATRHRSGPWPSHRPARVRRICWLPAGRIVSCWSGT